MWATDPEKTSQTWDSKEQINSRESLRSEECGEKGRAWSLRQGWRAFQVGGPVG